MAAAKAGELGVRHFFVWHALLGYWGGVQVPGDASDPLAAFGSRLAPPHLTPELRRMSHADALPREPFSVRGVGLVDRTQAGGFFDAYHSRLAAMVGAVSLIFKPSN